MVVRNLTKPTDGADSTGKPILTEMSDPGEPEKPQIDTQKTRITGAGESGMTGKMRGTASELMNKSSLSFGRDCSQRYSHKVL